jgi:hypothetical protein
LILIKTPPHFVLATLSTAQVLVLRMLVARRPLPLALAPRAPVDVLCPLFPRCQASPPRPTEGRVGAACPRAIAALVRWMARRPNAVGLPTLAAATCGVTIWTR